MPGASLPPEGLGSGVGAGRGPTPGWQVHVSSSHRAQRHTLLVPCGLPPKWDKGPGRITTCQHAVLPGGLAEVSGGCVITGARFLLQSWGPERLMD